MFTLIYMMLLAVWIYVMNDKISRGPEEATQADADDVHGRGLTIVGAVSESWGIQRADGADGAALKRVWARVALRPAAT